MQGQPRDDSTTPDQLNRYLRTAIVFLKDSSAEQLRQLPVLGPLLSGAAAAAIEFAHQTETDSLEQRVEQLLSIESQTQQTLGVVGALAQIIYLQQQDLLTRFEAAGLSVEPTDISLIAQEAALKAYRALVIATYGYADHRGIEGFTRARHIAALPLDDIYVLPDLKEEPRNAGISQEADDNSWGKRDRAEDFIESMHERLESDPRAFLRRERKPTTVTGSTLGKILGACSHLVVLGPPGSGKTVLIRYLARLSASGPEALNQRLGWQEDVVPVVTPLAQFADALGREPSLTLRSFIYSEVLDRGGVPLQAAIDRLQSEGRVFFMFDGLDEVRDESDRARVAQMVDRFIAEIPRNRFLITARPHGYIRLKGTLVHFSLNRFSAAQVRMFVHQWHAAFERWLNTEAPNLTRAAAEARQMLEEIRRNRRVAELATNPLMLIVISLIRLEGQRLPERRVELYNRATITLLETWNYWRTHESSPGDQGALPLDRLIRVLAAVAEWTRRTKAGGLVHRNELKRKLIEVLREREFDEIDPAIVSEEYLRSAANRAGLLEERAVDLFAFWHPTFEEFLAAVELATPVRQALSRLLPLRFDSYWRKVILLAVGYLGLVQRDQESATALVEGLLTGDPSPVEPITFPALRLAAVCVADGVGVRRSFAESVLRHLATAVQAQQIKSELEAAFGLVAWSLRDTRISEETMQALVPIINLKYSTDARRGAVRLAASIAGSSSIARSICQDLLKDKDHHVQTFAALALLRAGDYRVEVFEGLLFWTETSERDVIDEFKTMPEAALKALISSLGTRYGLLDQLLGEILLRLDPQKPEIFDWLRASLGSTIPGHELAVAQLLASCDKADSDVVKILRNGLNSGEAYSRLTAGVSLIQLGHVEKEVVDVLIGALRDDSSDRLVWSMPSGLTTLGRGENEFLGALYKVLASDKFADRIAAVAVLHHVGRNDEEMVSSLKGCLNSEDPDLVIRAAKYLVKIKQSDSSIVEPVRSCVLNSAIPRFDGIGVLVDVRRVDQSVTDLLRGYLKDQSLQPIQRLLAADLLAQHGHGDGWQLLLASLRIEDYSSAREKRAKTLAKIGRLREAVEALVQCIEKDGGNEHRYGSLIKGLNDEDSQTVKFVKECLYSENAKTSLAAARALRWLKRADAEVLTVLESHLRSDNLEIRLGALRTGVQIGMKRDLLSDALRSCLPDEATEPDWIPYEAADMCINYDINPDMPLRPMLIRTGTTQLSRLLAICERISAGTAITHEEGALLADVIKITGEEPNEQLGAIFWFRDWLWARLNPSESPKSSPFG